MGMSYGNALKNALLLTLGIPQDQSAGSFCLINSRRPITIGYVLRALFTGVVKAAVQRQPSVSSSVNAQTSKDATVQFDLVRLASFFVRT